jgi:hypothetical protein
MISEELRRRKEDEPDDVGQAEKFTERRSFGFWGDPELVFSNNTESHVQDL